VSSRRTTRVAQVLREELSRLITKEQTLDNLLITITDVTLAPDLKQATIFFSTLSQTKSAETVAGLLSRHAHHWHHEISKRVHMKYVPKLHFSPDDTIERGDRVLNILRELDQPEDHS